MCGVAPTWTHVVVRVKVFIVETGFLLVVKRVCQLLVMLVLIFFSFKVISELFHGEGMKLTSHASGICFGVILQLMLSMVIMISQ